MKIFLLTLFFLALTPSILFSQQTDSLKILPDSLTAISDSLLRTDKKKGSYDIDTTIFATAKDSLFFMVSSKKMKIFGEGELKYKNTKITSSNIAIDFVTSNIEATGSVSDSLEELKGTPVLSEGPESYEGKSMRYNFKTGQGYISVAQTEQEGAKYTGSKIKKVDKETFFIEDGIYTTCDEKCPHYYFEAAKMKVIQNEQLVAEWIWLNFGGVPFPIPLPFGVFPLQSGRRSGIIPPAFGSDATYGNYFSRFGYFWAISDYMDINLTTDYYTRGSYKFNSLFRYAERYNFTGNLEGSYGAFISGEETDTDRSENIEWRVRWNHNHSFTPTLRFDARLEFLSGTAIQRNVEDFNEVLRNEAVSNATLFKSWDESGNSMSLSYSRTQNFENNNISEVLPNLTFSLSQKYPFRSKTGGGQSLAETFGFSYSGQLQNNRNKVQGDLKTRGGIQHNIRTSIAPKVGYFSFTPNFNYNEYWYNKRVVKSAVLGSNGKDSVITNDQNEINFVRTFSTGVTAQTKFYGMFTPNVLGIDAIRHTVTPSISYVYQPDFSQPGWGYYDSYTSTTGEQVKYSKFEREIFGSPSSQEQQNINLAIGNVFEMKTKVDPTDTTSKADKIQLLNLQIGTGYNFAADSLNFSDIRLTYRTQVANFFSLNGASTFTPYDYSGSTTRVDKFLVSEGKGLLRLTNFSFSASLTLSGEKIASKDQTASGRDYDQEYVLGQSERSIYQGLYNDQDPDFSIPWDITLNYNYAESRPVPTSITKASNISGSFNFNLTPAWKFSLTGSYDLERKEFSAPQVRVSRDLHCWIMNFTWNPIGTYRGYRFEIRVKAPQLQDLKLTKRDQFFSGR